MRNKAYYIADENVKWFMGCQAPLRDYIKWVQLQGELRTLELQIDYLMQRLPETLRHFGTHPDNWRPL